MAKEKANYDPFFDPRWDEVWDRAELALLQQTSDEYEVAEGEQEEQQLQQQKSLPTLESLKQKSMATAETREKLQQTPFQGFLNPGPTNVIKTEGKHKPQNFWSRIFDTTPVDPQDSHGHNTHKVPPAKFSNNIESLSAEIYSYDFEKLKAAKNYDNEKRNSECEEGDLVDHKYIDYSLVSDKEVMHPGPLTSGVPIEIIFNKCSSNQVFFNAVVLPAAESQIMDALEPPHFQRVVETFPGKLHLILSKKEFRSIITWLPHGRSFIVRDPESLQEKVFPVFFKLKKYNSFSRQLSLWGFKRLTTGIDFGSYYHSLFLRGKPMLVTRMTLILIKGTGTKRKSNPRAEPDLTSLSRIRPLPDP